MRNLSGITRNVICSAALIVCASPSHAQMDSADPWQRDRAAHQERMDEQAQGYHDSWEKYKVERYKVDAVGVIDKAGARQEFDEMHAPVDLNAEDSGDDAGLDTDTDTELLEAAE